MPTPFLYAYLSTLRQKMDVFFVCSNCDSWVRRQTAIGASSDTLLMAETATEERCEPSVDPVVIAQDRSVDTPVQVDLALSVKIEDASASATHTGRDLLVVHATEVKQTSQIRSSSGTHPKVQLKTQSKTQLKAQLKTKLKTHSKTTPVPSSKTNDESQQNLEHSAGGSVVDSTVDSTVSTLAVKKNRTLLAVDRLILSIMLPGSYAPPEMRITQRLILTIRKDGGNNWLATICPPLVRRVLIDNDIRLESRKVLKSICLATWKSGRLQAVLGNATFAKNIRCSLSTVSQQP